MYRHRLFLLALLLALSGCTAAPTAVDLPLPQTQASLPTVVVTVSQPVSPTTASLTPEILATPKALPPAPTSDPSSPRGVVAAFYRWYFAQPQGEIMNQRSYVNSPLLTGIFKSDLNVLLDSFANTSGYDPFICAQNFLPSLTIAEVVRMGSEAHALAEVIFEGRVRHYFVVSLSTSETDWKIEAIHCPTEPETAALAFYTWYLGNIYGDQDAGQGGEVTRTPVTEETYRNFFLLTGLGIDQISQAAAAHPDIDPILDMQALPVRFTVLQGPILDGAQSGDIKVRLDYDLRTARYHIVHLVDGRMNWAIDAIEHVQVPAFDPSAGAQVDTTGWQAFTNEEYGFSLRYPPGWYVDTLSLAGLPKDDPLKWGKGLYAPALGREWPALWINVLEGSQTDMVRYYITENHQEVEINGHTVWVDRETCSTRFVFSHPAKPGVWLVIGDSCSTQPGREEYAAALEQVIAPLLRTVQFP